MRYLLEMNFTMHSLFGVTFLLFKYVYTPY
jgi:hypothetical protein